MNFEKGYEQFQKQVKEIENDTNLNEDEKTNKVIALIKQINEINYQMQLKITAVDIYKKQMSKNIQKIDNEINYEQSEAKQAKEETKRIVSAIKEAKKLHDRMGQENEKQNLEIERKFDELKNKIESKMDFTVEDLEKLEAQNEQLQKDINESIETFENKKKENDEKLKKLEKDYQEFNQKNSDKLKEANEEYESLKDHQKVFQQLENKNNKMVTDVQGVFQKLNNYEQIMNMKNESYIKYQKDLKELVDNCYKLHKRQKDLDEANKQASVVIMDIMKENEQLSNELKNEEKKTDNLKNLCKEKQEIIKNIN